MSIDVRRSAGIVTVTLDRPQKRNAVTLAMWKTLGRLFRDLAAEDEVRGIILTGAGAHFSAGANIADFAETRRTKEQGIAYEEAVDEACDAIAELGRPVVAAIRGICYGGACNLAMACDFRFVAEDSRFAVPAAKLSIVYGVRGTMRLLSLVGLAEAKRIFFSAEPFYAKHALATGFADALVEDPALAASQQLERYAALAPPVDRRSQGDPQRRRHAGHAVRSGGRGGGHPARAHERGLCRRPSRLCGKARTALPGPVR